MPISRKKSCRQCRAAKARCSLTAPCSRCLERHLGCDYEGYGPYRFDPYDMPDLVGTCATQLATERVEPWEARESGTADPLFGGILGSAHLGHDAAGGLPNLVYPGSTPEPVAPTPAISAPLDAFPGSQLMCWTDMLRKIATPSLTPSPRDAMLSPPIFPQELASECDILPLQSRSGSASIAQRPETSLAPRSWSAGAARLTTKVLFGQLLSYPAMLVSGLRLPPFIYPPCTINESSGVCSIAGSHECLPKTLAICGTIARMSASKYHSTASFVLGIIYNEIKRLKSECSTYDSGEILAALQATAIYIIMLSKDAAFISNEWAVPIVDTLRELGRRLVESSSRHKELYTAENITHEDWAFREAGGRTVCLVFGLELLLNFRILPEDLAECSGYSLIPVPCERELWEANTPAQWKRQLDASNAVFLTRTLHIRDLRNSIQPRGPGRPELDDADTERLAYWCERADSLGTLVWMAVMVESHR
ncbi:hypothetical protein GQ53DRAFT_837337 [Thozetella sp. PMI_491]|nr:hypothetical protein GQ53DRAFT_837337 [Thozetella sp. PMI_491]